ncbi:MAG: Ig-like domain-containing protein, partial [Clostridia bacterium]|nr:Ig-like domain-containing protein [Clostridia bacterium]
MKRKISLLLAAFMLMTNVSAAPSFVTDEISVTIVSEEDTSKPAPDYVYDFETDTGDWIREHDFFTYTDGGLVSKKDFVSQAWLSYEEWENFDLEFDFTVLEEATEYSHWFAPIIRGTNYMIIPSGGMQYNSPETGVQSGPGLPEAIELGVTWTMRIEAEETKGTVYIKKAGKGTFQKVGVMPISQKKGKLGFISFPAVVKFDNVKIWDTTVRPFEFENLNHKIAVGETVKLQILNGEDDKLTFESSDTSIATVNANGEVTTLKTGTAKIIATNEGGYSSSTTVNSVKYITGVAPVTMERSLYVGESINFKVNIHPEDATERNLVWTSSDENVIKIVGDTYNTRGIKAVGAGVAELLIKTPDGSAQGTCEFTVTER